MEADNHHKRLRNMLFNKMERSDLKMTVLEGIIEQE